MGLLIIEGDLVLAFIWYGMQEEYRRMKSPQTGALKDKFFFYAYLNKVSVKKGDKVEAGDVLGLTGSTGNATAQTAVAKGSHLQFEGRDIMMAGLGLAGRCDPLPLIRLK